MSEVVVDAAQGPVVPVRALLEKDLAQVLDGKTDPEDLHELYEGEDPPSNVQPLSASRVAA